MRYTETGWPRSANEGLLDEHQPHYRRFCAEFDGSHQEHRAAALLPSCRLNAHRHLPWAWPPAIPPHKLAEVWRHWIPLIRNPELSR